MASACECDEPGGLFVAVDHLLGEELACDAEGIHVRGHPSSLHAALGFVYMMLTYSSSL